MERVIIHSDLNNFFASVECLSHPEWKEIPFAVAGDTEKRHGIILAKNEIAKKYGITTGEPLWTAKQKCPTLLTCQPHYEQYKKLSDQARRIYYEYSDKVEPFGIDECWLDITPIAKSFDEGKAIGDEIRERIHAELGVTVSVGISFNKAFAKLGSDINKPNGTTVITTDNFKEKVWSLPAQNLLFVGKATLKALKNMNIKTIGDIANAPLSALEFILGKSGHTLWIYANGLDNSEVIANTDSSMAKSIGNSITTPRDLIRDDEINVVLYHLCDTVSERLRTGGYVCNTVQISIRDSNMNTIERQERMAIPNRTAHLLHQTAYSLLIDNHAPNTPIRALGVRACNLEKDRTQQLTLLSDNDKIEKYEQLESMSDSIRDKFGSQSLKRGIMLTDPELCMGNIRKK